MTSETDAPGVRQPRRRARTSVFWDSLTTFGLSNDGRGFRFWELLSIFGYGFGLIAVAIYAAGTHRFMVVFGILALVSSAAWLSGGVLGFLFGVPRLRASAAVAATAPTTSGLAPNTNLEQISDWLTKIIVGATLVQLRPLADDINSLALAVGAQLATPGAAPVSGAVMITYFAGGFMWGYLWCSLRVFREMSALISREQGGTRHEAAAVVVETAPAAAE
jgi:hypothetical protein